ncbi:HYR domain-containing protein [Chryseosolibacter indicus]|uniref:HYR domain-containing protein n=1 Tax=Chryseosolibacter indicus TaxID=2782351 RepID=A0ABS5VLE9_9BACT|nr:HYR domain-containing protein [Chryseosolibacter indicus]MBT1701936.1 HYR domain-containing protein [Chryseosolibacter indicus]
MLSERNRIIRHQLLKAINKVFKLPCLWFLSVVELRTYVATALLVTIISSYTYGQTCNDCPASSQCRPCQGNFISITLRYNGIIPAWIAASDGEEGIFWDFVRPGETFTVKGSAPGNRFERNRLTITVAGILETSILTSCEGNLFIGLLLNRFTVVAAESALGGKLCCRAGDVDTTNPQITNCPPTVEVDINPGECTKAVTWNVPTATDNCSVASFVSNYQPGFKFGIGTTKVTYTAKDLSGNTTTCSFDVRVRDKTSPVFSFCPGNITLRANEKGEAVATWSLPTATDNCSAVTLSSIHKPGDVFKIGKTEVVYTAKDNSGNASTCKFNVVVEDQSPPVITKCPSNITLVANTSCNAIATWLAPTANDNSGSVTLTSSHKSGNSFPIGRTEVTYTATDLSGNSSTCSFFIDVSNGNKPVITGCPGTITIASGESGKAVVQWIEPVATLRCGIPSVVSTHKPRDVFEIGSTEVTYTAKDDKGNSAVCKFIVKVEDKTGPAFTNCPGALVARADDGCNVRVFWDPLVATDHSGLINITSTHKPGDVFPIGKTEVTYKAIDRFGNASLCKFEVTVMDENLPEITGCPSDISAKADYTGKVDVEWTEPTATTPCGNVNLIASHLPGSSFSIGTTRVEYLATTANGAVASCRFNVVVSYDDIDFDIGKVITPDGDGINDTWFLKNIEKYKENKVIIVDRWGSEIFNASGYNNENIVWNGENKAGVGVPTGTYFYTISVKLGPNMIDKRGFIELIR